MSKISQCRISPNFEYNSKKSYIFLCLFTKERNFDSSCPAASKDDLSNRSILENKKDIIRSTYRKYLNIYIIHFNTGYFLTYIFISIWAWTSFICTVFTYVQGYKLFEWSTYKILPTIPLLCQSNLVGLSL